MKIIAELLNLAQKKKRQKELTVQVEALKLIVALLRHMAEDAANV